MLPPWKKSYDQPREHIKKQRHYFANKGPSSQSYGFPVVMYGCESWTIKKAEHRRNDAFELWCWRRLLRVPWTARRSNQPILKFWIFIGRTDAGAEAPILWLPDDKNWLIGKDADARKDWRQEEKGMTEDEMVGWNHWLNRFEFKQTPGVGDGRGSLVSCRGHKESDMTEWLNWTKSWRQGLQFRPLCCNRCSQDIKIKLFSVLRALATGSSIERGSRD